MRALAMLAAGSLLTISVVSGANAAGCTLATLVGTYALSSVQYVGGSAATMSPVASSGVVFFDGNGNMQFQSSLSTGTESLTFTGSGIYVVDAIDNPFTRTTSSCFVTVTTTSGPAQGTANYYLSMSGDTYYGLNTSPNGDVRAVKADRISRPP